MENSVNTLTKEQEKSLVSFIVEYVDKNRYKLPGYNQIFKAKKAELSKLKITQEQVRDFYKSESYKNIRDIKDRFGRDEIRNGFGSFTKFYDWFMKQLKKQNYLCYYCETHKNDLERIFRVKGEPKEKQTQKPLYSTKFSATFHIDRKIPKKPYSNTDNCVLACAFCNNAKSDMVKGKGLDFFEKHFKDFVRKLYTHLDSTIKYLD